jgi:hypothetical protein
MQILRLSKTGANYLLTCITIGLRLSIMLQSILPCTVAALYVLTVWLSIVELLNYYRRSMWLRFIFILSVLCYNVASGSPHPQLDRPVPAAVGLLGLKQSDYKKMKIVHNLILKLLKNKNKTYPQIIKQSQNKK